MTSFEGARGVARKEINYDLGSTCLLEMRLWEASQFEGLGGIDARQSTPDMEQCQQIVFLISTLRISAFLCASAVKSCKELLTAETQRYAEIRRGPQRNQVLSVFLADLFCGPQCLGQSRDVCFDAVMLFRVSSPGVA